MVKVMYNALLVYKVVIWAFCLWKEKVALTKASINDQQPDAVIISMSTAGANNDCGGLQPLTSITHEKNHVFTIIWFGIRNNINTVYFWMWDDKTLAAWQLGCQSMQRKYKNSCEQYSYIRSVYTQCYVDLFKCTEQNVSTFTQVWKLYVHVFFCLKVIRSWLKLPIGGVGHVICKNVIHFAIPSTGSFAHLVLINKMLML